MCQIHIAHSSLCTNFFCVKFEIKTKTDLYMPRKAVAPQVDSDSKWNNKMMFSQGCHLWTVADTPILGIIFNF